MGEVVDGRLKVKGVKGLRVCDASVFPNNGEFLMSFLSKKMRAREFC